MYGKLMSISDELMWKYYTFLTDLRASEIDAMRDEVSHGGLHPMKVKKDLAWSITRDFHSAADADAAAENWAKQFQQRGVADDAPVVQVSLGAEGLIAPATEDMGTMINIAKLLVIAGLAPSAKEAHRKLQENAVTLNGEKFSGRVCSKEALGDSPVLRLGKKSVRLDWLS
jgi:tyrosyl-tRNA synthetase